MARAPFPVTEARRVQPRPFSAPRQRIRTSAEAFGADEARALQQVGQGLQDVGEAASRIALREQERQSQLDTLQAKKRLNDFELGLSAPGGALTRRGTDADGSSSETEAAFNQLREEILGNTSTGARDAVAEMIENRRRSTLGGVARHEREQRETVELRLHEEGVAGERDAYAAASVDAEGAVVPEALARMRGNVAEHWRAVGRMQGLPPEVVEASIERDVSAAHRARVERMLANGEGTKARAYMERYGDQMTEADESALEGHVRDAAVGQQAQDTADSLAALPFDQQISEARKIGDEELRDETIRKLRLNRQIDNEIRGDRERVALESVWRKQGQAGANLTAFERSVMTPAGIRQWEEGHARIQAGLPLVTDPRKRTEFSFLTPQERRDMPIQEYLRDWAPFLDSPDRDWAESLLRGAREGSARAPRQITGAMSRDEAIDNMVRRVAGLGLGTRLADLSDAQAQLRDEVIQDLDRRIIEWEETNQRKAGSPEIRDIIEAAERDYLFSREGINEPALARDFGRTEELEDAFVPTASMRATERADMVQMANANGRGLSTTQLENAVGLNRIRLNPDLPAAVRREAELRLKMIVGDF